MATPEIEPKTPEQVKRVEDRFDPEIEKRLQEVGAQVYPTHPQTTQDDHGQPITQAVGDDQAAAGNTVQIPTTQAQAQSWSTGSISDSRTWLGASILRRIKKAIHYGWKIIIRK